MRYIKFSVLNFTLVISFISFISISNAEIFIDKNIDRNHYASKCVKNSYYDGLKQALKEQADPNYVDANGQSLISIAAGLNNIKTVELLLSYNANPNLYDKDHNNAYLLAASHSNIEMLKLLFRKSKFKININAVDKNDNTALMIAINNSQYDTVKFLIEKGSSVNYINKKKLTPLLIGVMFGKDDSSSIKIIDLLLSKNANINVKSSGNISVIDYAKKRQLHNIYKKLSEYQYKY